MSNKYINTTVATLTFFATSLVFANSVPITTLKVDTKPVKVGNFKSDKSKPLQSDLIKELKTLSMAQKKSMEDYIQSNEAFSYCYDSFASQTIDKSQYTECSIKATMKTNRVIDKNIKSFKAFNTNLSHIVNNVKSSNESFGNKVKDVEALTKTAESNINKLQQLSRQYKTKLEDLASNAHAKLTKDLKRELRGLSDKYIHENALQARYKTRLNVLAKAIKTNARILDNLDEFQYGVDRRITLLGYRKEENQNYIVTAREVGAIEAGALIDIDLRTIFADGIGFPTMPTDIPSVDIDIYTNEVNLCSECNKVTDDLTIQQALELLSTMTGEASNEKNN